MSDTKRHKEKAKFNNDLIELKDVSQNTRSYWRRINSDSGTYRKQRIEKHIAILKNADILE